MIRTLCIVNPNAASGRTGRRWPAVRHALERAGVQADALVTSAPGEATALTRAALKDGYERVVAVGGDGTIHEVVNGFFDAGAPLSPTARLGVIPGGTGSDLIRTLGLPRDPAGAIAAIARDRFRRVDLGRVRFVNHQGEPETRLYINTASVGLSGEVVARTAALPDWLGGPLGYSLAGLQGLIGFAPFPIGWSIDGADDRLDRALMLVVANGRYFGGGMQPAPQAQLDDGLLDVVVVPGRPLAELLWYFPKLFTGTHMGMPGLVTARARKVTVSGGDRPLRLEVDGEQPGFAPATFETVPAALHVIT